MLKSEFSPNTVLFYIIGILVMTCSQILYIKLKIIIFVPKMVQSGPKKDQQKGQNLDFFKYSQIIYRWKVYGKVITNYEILFEIFHF